MPKGIAIAKMLGGIAKVFADVGEETLDKRGSVTRSPIYFLLKLRPGPSSIEFE